MKVYVDEMPKNCFECPCFKNDLEFPCGLSDACDYFLDEIDGGECPLHSITEHNKKFQQQLAEKDRIIESLKQIHESVVQTCYNDAKEIDRLNKVIEELELKNNKLGTDLCNAEDITSYLQQQLAEKDRLINLHK